MLLDLVHDDCMARPPHPLGTWGKITRTPLGSTGWRARAWYRDYDGVTRPVDRYAETGAKAERALTTALSARSKAHGDSLVTPDTQLEDLARLWLDIRRREHPSTGTLDLYEQTVRTHIRPGVGRVRVRQEPRKWEPLIADPRRYGFHATLKPPMAHKAIFLKVMPTR